MIREVEGQVSMFGADTSFGRMSVAHSQATEEKTSESSWKSWQGSSKKESLFLDLRKASGQPRESSSAQIFPSHGKCSIVNGGAFHSVEDEFVWWLTSTDTQLRQLYLANVNTTEAPSEEIVSRLSDILEKNPDPKKYNLSAKACQGILNRANRRGKTLPPMLQEALEQVIEREFGIDPYNGAITGDKARNASGCQRMPDKDNFNAIIQPIAIDMGGGKTSVDIHTDRSPTLTTTHYGEPAVVCDARGNGDGTVAPTMTGDHQNRVTDYTGVVVTYSKSKRTQSATDNETWVESNKTNTLNAFDVGDVRTTEAVVTLTGDTISGTLMARDFKGVGRVDTFDRVVCQAVDARNCTENDVNGSLQRNSAHSLNGNNVVRVKYIVRRLTPLECERLQGFPDGHTDIGEYIDTKGKRCKTSDASRYKALGNSIALPSWKFVLKRLCSHYERDATMASLFDGIGGYPLLWEQINGKGSCLWASEVENFCIAVTERRINNE